MLSVDHAPESPSKYMTTIYHYFCIKNEYFCSSNDNKLFRRSGSLLLIQHYIYKRHCINCNVQLHSTIAVKDTNRYELRFKQFMLITLIGKYCNISPLIKD